MITAATMLNALELRLSVCYMHDWISGNIPMW
jgi:hypothetical protein